MYAKLQVKCMAKMYTPFQKKKHLTISGPLFAYAVPRYFLQFSVLILKIIGHLIES